MGDLIGINRSKVEPEETNEENDKSALEEARKKHQKNQERMEAERKKQNIMLKKKLRLGD